MRRREREMTGKERKEKKMMKEKKKERERKRREKERVSERERERERQIGHASKHFGLKSSPAHCQTNVFILARTAWRPQGQGTGIFSQSLAEF